MEETLVVSKALKLKNTIIEDIDNILNDDSITLAVGFYDKDRPFIGPKPVNVVEDQIKSTIQSIDSKIKRVNAINNAIIKFNSETKVTVPKFISICDIINNKYTNETEEITIAEAINRKAWCSKVYSKLSSNLQVIYANELNNKKKLEEKVDYLISEEMKSKFPSEMSKNWSDTKYTEAKETLKNKHEIITIDPLNLISSDAINVWRTNIIRLYEDEIDTILSIANASNTITISY